MKQKEINVINRTIGFLTAVAKAKNNVFADGAFEIWEQLEELMMVKADENKEE